MTKKLPKLQDLRKKSAKHQPELTKTYKIYAWTWLVLSLNWAAWVVQASLTSKSPDSGFGIAFALPGLLVATLAVWLLKCKPENRRALIVGIGATTTLFFIASWWMATLCLVLMFLALKPRKP